MTQLQHYRDVHPASSYVAYHAEMNTQTALMHIQRRNACGVLARQVHYIYTYICSMNICVI